MLSNIQTSNISKHIINNDETCHKHDTKIHQTKIVNYDFFSVNEANISDKIKQMKNYSNHFLVLDDYDFININKLNKYYIENMNVKEKYLLFKYKNVKIISFYNFLFNINNPKNFIFHLMNSFSSILKSVLLLNDHNICFFHLSPNNIVFQFHYREKPVLQDFELSLQLSKLNEKYITRIISKIDNFSYKPLEVHILFYIIHNNIESLSYSLIIEMVENFVKNADILSFFDEAFHQLYKDKCIETLKKYINVPRTEIIKSILQHCNKWDIYSLSKLYLSIFIHVIKHFSLQQTPLNEMSKLLLQNIDPDPIKRGTMAQLLNDYNLLFDNSDWTFVKKLSTIEMDSFHDLTL
jgi:hypothetical protein